MTNKFKLSISSIINNKIQSILSIGGVIFSSIMITVIIVLASSLLESLINDAKLSYGEWHFAIEDATKEQLDLVIKDENVSDYVLIQNGNFVHTDNLKKPYSHISYVSKNYFDMMFVKLIEGKYPENDNEIVVGKDFLEESKYKIGDEIDLEVGKRFSEEYSEYISCLASYSDDELLKDTKECRYRIVGVYENEKQIKVLSNIAYPFISISNGIKNNETNNYIYIELKNYQQVYEYSQNFANEQHLYYNSELLSVLGVSGSGESLKEIIYILAIFLIIIIVVATIVLISNAFYISINQRIKQYVLLSSLGLSNSGITQLVMAEGIIISIIGIPVGGIIGIILISISVNTIGELISSSMYNDISFVIEYSWLLLLISFLICFITVMISIYYPVRKINKRVIAGTLKSDENFQGDDSNADSIERLIFKRNCKKYKKKYRSAVISLTLSFSLMVIADIFCYYWDKSLQPYLDSTIYDVQCTVSVDNILQEKGIYDLEIEKLTDVKKTVWRYESTIEEIIKFDRDSFSQEWLENNYDSEEIISLNCVLVDDSSIDEMFIMAYDTIYNKNGEQEEFKRISILKDEYVNLEISGEIKKVKVHNITDDLPLELVECSEWDDILLIMPYSCIEKYNINKEGQIRYLVTTDNHKGVVSQIEQGQYREEIMVFDLRMGYEVESNMLTVSKVFTNIFSLLLCIISTINAFITIVGNVLIRKKEMCIFQSLGMSINMLKRIVLKEYIHFFSKSLVLGISISMLMSIILRQLLCEKVEIELYVPYYSLLKGAMCVIGIMICAYIYIYWYLKKNNIADSLKDETT